MKNSPYCIGVIGLGYVGLPLAVAFSNKYPVIGFDINERRIGEIQNGIDVTMEIDEPLLKKAIRKERPEPGDTGLFCTNALQDLANCSIYIITVPTPIDKNNRPD